MMFQAVVEAVNDWDNPLTPEKIRDVLRGLDCSPECETISLRVISLQEIAI